MDPFEQGSARKGSFPTTRWTLVVAAGRTDAPDARPALEALCRAYWRPLYLFARRAGHDAEMAKDLVQGFFTAFLSRNYFAEISPEKGRLRNYLIGAFRHFLEKERRHEAALKRGGGIEHVSLELDVAECERHWSREVVSVTDPEAFYVRTWAVAVLDCAMRRLRELYASRGRETVYDALVKSLEGDPDSQRYADVARALDMSLSAVKMAAFRLREDLRVALREEVADTVSDHSDVESELQYLYGALGRA